MFRILCIALFTLTLFSCSDDVVETKDAAVDITVDAVVQLDVSTDIVVSADAVVPDTGIDAAVVLSDSLAE
jgi:hypothetical protein